MNKKHSQYNHWPAWTILLLTFFASFIFIWWIARNSGNFHAFITHIGLTGPLASIAIFALLSVTPISSDPFSIVMGAVYGPLLGGFISWMGNNLAALLEFYIGESVAAISHFQKNRKNLPFGLGKFPAKSFWFLFLGRFFPYYGGKLVSVAGGLYKVPFWRYLWTAVLANFIGGIIFALTGYGLLRLL